jgi:hypothetical protein
MKILEHRQNQGFGPMTELLSPSLYVETPRTQTFKGAFVYPRTKYYYYKESRKNCESYSTPLEDGQCKSFPSADVGFLQQCGTVGENGHPRNFVDRHSPITVFRNQDGDACGIQS